MELEAALEKISFFPEPANKELWEKRQKFTDTIEELRQSLQGRINEAFAEVECEKQLLAIYEHFFILAEHDHKVALRFFRDTQSEEDVEILEKLKPGAFAEHIKTDAPS